MRNPLALPLVVAVCACGTEAGTPSASGGGAGAAGEITASGSAGVSAGGSGAGAPAGGAGTSAVAGQAGQGGTGGSAGAGGSPTVAGAAGSAGAGGSGGAPSFECSQLTGPNVAGEWFDAGFETAVGSAKWQVKAPHHSFVEDWANPNHDVWRDSDCQGIYTNCETKSQCEGATPDRVLFVTQTGDYLNTPQVMWESSIESAITTLKAKYLGLKRVELLTFVRGPEGQNCGGETTVSPMLDAAQQAVAARSGGFVTVGPHLTASGCALFSGPPHMNAQGNTEVAVQLADHYQ